MRATQPGIVIVMIIVGTAPNAAGAERVNPESPHQELRQARFTQDGMVLLVMVDDKKPENQQAGDNAASDSRHERKAGKGRGERQEEKESSRSKVPPTPQGVIVGEGFRGGNKFRASSQLLQLYSIKLPQPARLSIKVSVTFLHRATTPRTVDRRRRTE